MDENCPFCKIISGDIPSQKVYEDEQVFAVLDINPARPGHILVLPKEHQFILPLLSPEQYSALLLTAKKIIPSLHTSMIVNKVSLFAANGPAAGQQSPHAFIHLIPREEGDGLEHLDLAQGSVEQSARDAIKQNTQQILQRLPPITQSQTQTPPQKKPVVQENQVAQDEPVKNSEQAQDQLNNIFAMLEKNPELHELFLKDPDSVIEGVKNNPVLAQAFKGVDLRLFAQMLREQTQKNDESTRQTPEQRSEPLQEDATTDTQNVSKQETKNTPQETRKQSQDDVPQAIMMNDEELLAFLDEKKQLKELLIHDPEGLAEIIPKNERLADFFLGTNPQALHERLITIEQNQSSQQEGDTASSQEDDVDFDMLARHLK